MEKLIYYFDIDGTLCSLVGKNKYAEALPNYAMIEEVNKLFDEGNTIVLYTARGRGSGIDWDDLIKKQVSDWGIKHHKLDTKTKPSWDWIIDDKSMSPEFFKKNHSKNRKVGLIAGSFDILHLGYIKMFEEAKTMCDYLVVALHDDPNKDRSNKLKPIHTLEERREILTSNRHVDFIIPYTTEEDLDDIGRRIKPHVRIVGDDYRGREQDIHGKGTITYFTSRKHGWSTTKLKEKIAEQINERKNNG